LAVLFVYTEIDDDEMGWCATVPPSSSGRVEALRAQLGDEAMGRLFAEARTLWEELGYSDDSPNKRVP
jgi:hypothetical protein